LSTAGGQELRDAVAQAATTETLTNSGDGKIEQNIFFYYIFFFI
jgi:hypothetical protein